VTPPELLPSRLSYSAIAAYLACPASFKFGRIDRLERPGAPPDAAFGTALHRMVQACLVAKASGDPYDPVQAWAGAWAAVQEHERIAWGAELPEQYETEGLVIANSAPVRSFLASVDLLVDEQGAAVEREIEFTVPGVPVPIIGYVDLIDAAHVPYDLKTSRRAWTSDRALNELQPLFYLTALNQRGGGRNPDHVFRHVNIVRAGRAATVQVFETRRTLAEMLWAANLIREVWRGISSGVFPTNPTTWKCSPRWCEFWPVCRGKLADPGVDTRHLDCYDSSSRNVRRG
jgi:hypothetical protein